VSIHRKVKGRNSSLDPRDGKDAKDAGAAWIFQNNFGGAVCEYPKDPKDPEDRRDLSDPKDRRDLSDPKDRRDPEYPSYPEAAGNASVLKEREEQFRGSRM
jgi:hypothetical protein